MCGIFGYLGNRNGCRFAIDGLKKMEYRGYDSCGLAYIYEGKIHTTKVVGKVVGLEKACEKILTDVSSPCVIAHTRWATHGKVTKENAHPIFDSTNSVAVVHNGIIENFHELRTELEKEGISFRTETDTEIIANLVAKFYHGDLLEAVQEVMQVHHESLEFQ